jgi:hypothetical protein
MMMMMKTDSLEGLRPFNSLSYAIEWRFLVFILDFAESDQLLVSYIVYVDTLN